MKHHPLLTAVLVFAFVSCDRVAPAEEAAALPESRSDANAPSEGNKVAPLGSAAKPAFAKLGAATKPKVAALGRPKAASLGKPGKPKFALKMTGGGGAGAAAPDRAAEVKRLIEAYHRIAISYADRMVLASTPEEIAEAKKREPSARALRPIVRLIAEVVAVDPTDEPALEALLFLSKYVGVPIIDETLAKAVFADGTKGVVPNDLILRHHADADKLDLALRLWPKSAETDEFLALLFEKTHSPKVRAAAGIRLIKTLQMKDQEEGAERLAVTMAEDRYLDGVPITRRPTGPTARDWAEGKLRELRLLGIGQVLPEVFGETLDGDVERITAYRGKVVVMEVWTTWCGPCVAMIPHHAELAERYRDQPFAILSVSCDEERETLEEFLEARDMPWNHWWVGSDGELKETLNVRVYPTVFVLDENGVIRHKNIKDDELEEAIESLLGEVKSPSEES